MFTYVAMLSDQMPVTTVNPVKVPPVCTGKLPL